MHRVGIENKLNYAFHNKLHRFLVIFDVLDMSTGSSLPTDGLD